MLNGSDMAGVCATYIYMLIAVDYIDIHQGEEAGDKTKKRLQGKSNHGNIMQVASSPGGRRCYQSTHDTPCDGPNFHV